MKYTVLLDKIAWPVILTGIFIRPFISANTFIYLNSIIVDIFIVVSFLYLCTKKIKPVPIDIAVAMFFIGIIISVLISPLHTNSSREFYNYIFLTALFYTARASHKENKKELFLTVIISAVFVSIYSLRALFVVSNFALKYLSAHHISHSFAQSFIERRRAFSPFISPNLLAGYLVMIIMLCYGIITQEIKDRGSNIFKLLRKGHQNNTGAYQKVNYILIVSAICLILSLVTLFFTKSIGGWTTLIVCVLLFIFTTVRKINKQSAAILFLLITLLATVFFIRTQGKQDFTKPAFSVQKRLEYWRETIHIIALHPITGTGLGNFSLKDSRVSHNSFLQIWAEMGILEFAIWLIIVFLFIKKGINNISSGKSLYYNTGLFTGGMSFLLHNTISFSFFIPQSAFLWWIILAFQEY